MAYELVEEVLDHAPASLDAAEILLLTVIAEQARSRSRSADIPRDLLLRRLRIGEPGLRKVFKRLEKHGIEVRVPLRVRPDGVAVYAMIGHVCSFKLPDFQAPENCPCHRCKEAIPQALLRKEESPQLPEREPQLPEREPQLPEREPQAPPPVPSIRYGGVRGHASTARPDGGQEHDPFPSTPEEQKQWARRRLKEGSRKHHINGHNHPDAFEALLSAGQKPEEQT